MMTCIRDGWRVAGGKKVKKVGKSQTLCKVTARTLDRVPLLLLARMHTTSYESYLLVVMHTAYRSTSYCLRRCGASSKMIKYLRARTLCR